MTRAAEPDERSPSRSWSRRLTPRAALRRVGRAALPRSLGAAPPGLLRSATRSSTRRSTRRTATRCATARCRTATSRVEYPPGALPVFVVPALGDDDVEAYRRRVRVADGALRRASLVVLRWRSRSRALGAALGAGALAFVAVAPLAARLGRPHALRPLAGALIASARSRRCVSAGCGSGSRLLGAAVAAKLYPVVLVPLVVAYVWRARGRREALRRAPPSPSAVVARRLRRRSSRVAPGGRAATSVWRQLARPLQIESLGRRSCSPRTRRSALDLTMSRATARRTSPARRPTSLAVLSRARCRSRCSSGSGSRFARGPAHAASGSCATRPPCVVAFVALGKVLSPQFLIWLVPLVPLVRGRAGFAASALLARRARADAALVPVRYWDLRARVRPLRVAGSCSRATSCWSRCWPCSSARHRHANRSRSA